MARLKAGQLKNKNAPGTLPGRVIQVTPQGLEPWTR